MATKAQILMGSEDADYDSLQELAENHKVGWWSCLKETQEDALLYFYFIDPRRAIVASAIAASKAKPGNDAGYDWIVDIKNVTLYAREKQLTLQELRGIFPDWGWLKKTRKETYLTKAIANKLKRLLEPNLPACSRAKPSK